MKKINSFIAIVTFCFLSTSFIFAKETPEKKTQITIQNIKSDIDTIKKEFKDLENEVHKKPSPWAAITIAGIGVIIALSSLLWNIYSYFKQNKSKFRIDYNLPVQIVKDPLQGISDPVLILSFTITNISKIDRYIKKPFIRLPYKVEVMGVKNKNIIAVDTIPFPKSLKSGEQYKSNFELGRNLLEYIRPSLFNRSCRLGVEDTFNKTFYSKKINLSLLKSHCIANINFKKSKSRSL